jgi:hypothetical protein
VQFVTSSFGLILAYSVFKRVCSFERLRPVMLFINGRPILNIDILDIEG